MANQTATGSLQLHRFSPWLHFLVVSVLLAYLYLGTGIHSDDYALIMISQNWSFSDWLTLYKQDPIYFNALPLWYFSFAQYILFDYQSIYYDLAKVAISFFAFFAAWLFTKQFLAPRRSLLFALLFVLYPIHDGANYLYIGTYMMMTGAWIMLSHVLISRGSIKTGMAVGMLGAFWSYASPPLVCGLAMTFLVQKKVRQFFLFVQPLIIYIVYYFSIARLYGTVSYRTKDITNPIAIAKQFALQIATFIDAAVGPSFWLKIYYSIHSLNWVSAIVGAMLTVFFWRLLPKQTDTINRPLLLAFSTVALCGFLIFAITGAYPQIAFNLGNRVTYFGSMLLALLVLSMHAHRATVIVLAIFSLSIVGLSDHWKAWNQEQNQVIENIRTNQDLINYQGKVLFVTGYQYSHLGAISHIEFFSENFVVGSVFYYAMGKVPPYPVLTLNKRNYFDDMEVIDRKYGSRITVGNTIAVYEAEKNKLSYYPVDKLNTYIESFPNDTRHWVQLLEDGYIRNAVLFLMPRLKYVFS